MLEVVYLGRDALVVVSGKLGEELEGVYFSGGVLVAVEDWADGVGKLEGVRAEDGPFVDGQVD